MSLAIISDNISPYQFCTPKGVGSDPASVSQKSTHLKIFGTEDTLTLPILTCTKVHEVRQLLENSLGLNEGVLRFTMKQGCSIRTLRDGHEMGRQVTVHGIKSWKRARKTYKQPHVVIGAGHLGLRTALTWVKEGFEDFVVFDRQSKIGGKSWLEQANKTSRLQTESGSYHLQWGGDEDVPVDAVENPWPSRDHLLRHFEEVAQRFGIMPYIRLHTDVVQMRVVGRDYWEQTYEVTVDGGTGEEKLQCASVALFPGNLTNPKIVTYPGEEDFGATVVYGIQNGVDYNVTTGENVVIIGSGAFAVENLRTCVEHSCKKIFMVCRRKTLSMPRVVSWLINSAHDHITAAMALDTMAPMYDLIGVDQWSYYAVYANASRTTANIRQSSRFGIGDIFFLAMFFGKAEHVVDDVKRLSHRQVHLVSGRRLDPVGAMLKTLGFNGEVENDRLMKLKEIFGYWCNQDHRRYLVAEPIGVEANNFASTSFSAGADNWVTMHLHFLNHPRDWIPIQESDALPRHAADESTGRPAYVVDARHGSITAITVVSMVPLLAEDATSKASWKRSIMSQCHPMEKFLEAAKHEWDAYASQMKAEGYEKEAPEYPYTPDIVQKYLDMENAHFEEQQQTMQKLIGDQKVKLQLAGRSAAEAAAGPRRA